jgi:flagellar M-ring protein FliF
MDFLQGASKRISDFFVSLSFTRRVALIGTCVLILATVASMFIWAGKTSYTVLVTNLAPEDSTSIIRYLRDKKIPFVVDETGKTVSVPPEKVYDLRLELASSGLAQTGVVGYEVFDKQSFGATSTVQRINEQRALEGELIRTINHLKGVDRSRVHLAIPLKSAFLDEERKPTASVVLELTPGFMPNEEEIRGIQRMVSSAVKNMDEEAVAIISSNGKQLSQNARDPEALFAAQTMDYQRKFESKMEGKIDELLQRVLGDGKVVARVNADFDFSRVSETQTILDGENAVALATNKDSDSMAGSRPLPIGAPGAKSQVPGVEQGAQSPASVVSNNTSRQREVTNFEIPRITRQMNKPMATLKRLSVAVMVDGVRTTDAAAPGGVRYEPVSDERLAQLKGVIANAVGWDEKRDPAIEIKTMPFYQQDIVGATEAANATERNRTIGKVAQWLGIGLIFTLFFIFVVRPFIKWITENTVDNIENFLPKTIEELEKNQQKTAIAGMEELLPEIEERVDPEKVQSEMLREKLLSIVNDNPHKASQILHEWIHLKVEKKDNKSA